MNDERAIDTLTGIAAGDDKTNYDSVAITLQRVLSTCWRRQRGSATNMW